MSVMFCRLLVKAFGRLGSWAPNVRGLLVLRLCFLIGMLIGLPIGVQATDASDLDSLSHSIELPESLVQDLGRLTEDRRTPFDVKQWVTTIKNKDYRNAAHQWATIDASIAESYRPLATIHFVAMTWNLGARRTAMDLLLTQLARPKFAKSKEWKAAQEVFYTAVKGEIPRLTPIFSEVQLSAIQRFAEPNGKIETLLRGWSMVYSAQNPSEAIKTVGKDVSWRSIVETRAAYLFAKDGDPQKGIELLQSALSHVKNQKSASKGESAETGDASLLFNSEDFYHLQLARLYYQSADLKNAEAHYVKVSKGSPEYLDAREELLWVRLRNNDVATLRGDILSFETLGQLNQQYLPELYVIRAISNLKLCMFDAAKSDFASFLDHNKHWAREIQTQLTANQTGRPPRVSLVTQVVERSIPHLGEEIKHVKKLHQESIAAGLPAAGRQSHWVSAVKQLEQDLSLASARVQSDYQKQWQSHARQMQEAIRKMKFVKVELMSQLATMPVAKSVDRESGTRLASADAEASGFSMQKNQDTDVGERNYPFDGVVWTDELFQLKSDASNVCF